MRIFDVPGGTEVEYKITDNAKILPPYATWNGDPVLPTTGTVTVPAGGTGLRNVFVDLPGIYPFLAHYTEPVSEYLQVRIVDPASIGISGAGVQYGDIGNTEDPTFASASSTPSLSIRTTDWSDHPELWEVKVGDTFLNLLNSINSPWTIKDGFINIDEDQTASLPIELIAQNVEPDAQTYQWYLIIGGDATRYFQNLSDISLARDPDLRGVALDALDFDNAATTADLKAGGRYRMGTSIQLDGADATIDTDVIGFIGIGRIVPQITGEFYTYIWSEPLKIVNTVPAPWDPVQGLNQIAVVPGQGSVNEGDTVRFFVFDKAKSDNPAYDDYNDATPIPAGTELYFKISGGENFTLADVDSTDPAYDFVEQYGTITMRADGNAGPVDVTFAEGDGYEDSEQMRLLVKPSLPVSPSTAANSAWVTVVNTDPPDYNLTWENAFNLAVVSIQPADSIGTTTLKAQLHFAPDGSWVSKVQTGAIIQNSGFGRWMDQDSVFDPADFTISYSIDDVSLVDGPAQGSFGGPSQGAAITATRVFNLEYTPNTVGAPGQAYRLVTITITGPGGETATRTVRFTCTVETR
jgi:hypothetical protein